MSPIPNSPDDENSSNHSGDDDEVHNDNNNAGYCLLSDNPDIFHDDDDENPDDAFLRFATQRVVSSSDNEVKSHLSITPSNSIWSTKLESESFLVDDDKANHIKTLMASIQLPQSSVPQWAQYCSEKDWQEKLRERIACRQMNFFS